ncbi:MAG: hydrolase [Candidatus Cohnella colombiensis]|uniref:Hydrolase n=1 Tax=Candidatus Cohnella colombiensis TaxID=3121368 RepID=A0AA95JDK1_9BACL|nr:MAG: hydrolase [Cohnella sp.]
MIYASDLDQTLIYSTRSMGIDTASPLVMPAETIDGKVSSYISIAAFNQLQRLNGELNFIPVTTRTIAQYKRIELFYEQVQPKYAITSNGGNILVEGTPDLEWNEYIRGNVASQSAPMEQIRELIEAIWNEEWCVGQRYCDELFIALVIHREIVPWDVLNPVVTSIRELGWDVSIQGRKIYFVPRAVSKQAALAHLKQFLGASVVIASGDSLLDQCLLDFADYPIAARHGELYREQERNPRTINYSFTSHSGVLAADQIVDYAYDAMRRYKDANKSQSVV